MAQKHRNIYLRDVVEIQATNQHGTFILLFHDYKKNVTVRLILPRWFIGLIATELWDVINDEAHELVKLENLLAEGVVHEDVI